METIKVVCPHCLEVNRVPKKESYKKALCGKCKGNLLNNTPIQADNSNFDYILANTDLPVIIDFWAEWCGPCKMFAPTFSEVSKKFPLKAQFLKVNTEIAREIAMRYRIQSIPTIVVIKNGVEKDRVMGALPFESFYNWVLTFL